MIIGVISGGGCKYLFSDTNVMRDTSVMRFIRVIRVLGI